MAGIDPYSSCPCGSGKKYKWCCHKAESYVERAQRLYDNHQVGPALDAIREGLRKEPNNPWLMIREAAFEFVQGRKTEAIAVLHALLKANPKHPGALDLLTRMTLETENATAAVAVFQQVLAATPVEDRAKRTHLAMLVAAELGDENQISAALQHLRLARSFSDEDGPEIERAINGILSQPSISPWEKNPDVLSPAPESISDQTRVRFEEALGWASEGLWSSAAAAFDLLSTDRAAGPLASRNAGFCRLWIGDNPGAVASLRRSIKTLGTTTEAVDLEALCQTIEPPHRDDMIEHVRQTWPLRNRPNLIAALNADPTVHALGTGNLNPDDPESPEVELYDLLDRPRLESAPPDLTAAMIPKALARVVVGTDTVSIEGYDDGRLGPLWDRLSSMVRNAIPSAHPKTVVLEKVPSAMVHLGWTWLEPENLDESQRRALNAEQACSLIRDVWPTRRLRELGGRTPTQAAKAGDAPVALRAALRRLEETRVSWAEQFDFAAFRARLGVEPEPTIDPSTVDLDTLHVSRFSLVPVEWLDDRRLVELYSKARMYGNFRVHERCALRLVERPDLLSTPPLSVPLVYIDLATHALGKSGLEAALEWIARGRDADPPASRASNLPHWEMTEIRFKSLSLPPEKWVPDLAVALERYDKDEDATRVLLQSLLQMGLLRVVPNPEDPQQLLMDTRRLAELLTRYGPRVTTASGELGVSAVSREIWTPGGQTPAKGAGAIWTPGSSAPAADPAKKLILRGR
jgi:hypothetical protein